MRDADLTPFTQLLDAACSLLSRGTYQPNPINTALFFRALQPYAFDAVRAGFDAHVRDPQRGRFVPMPADIIAQIEGLAANDGRPGADEAWAIAVAARDEAATVVWTDEMQEAWGVATMVMDLGDEVGARMAFKDAYGRLVDEARRRRNPPSWQVSMGHDSQGRREAIERAVEAGRLPPSTLEGLPAPAGEAVALLEGPAVKAMPDWVRDQFASLRERLTRRDDGLSRDEMARRDTQARKAAAQAQVDAYAAGHSAAQE